MKIRNTVLFSVKILLLSLLFLTLFNKKAFALDCNLVNFTITNPANYQTYQRINKVASIKVDGQINETGGIFTVNFNGVNSELKNVVYAGGNFHGLAENLWQGQSSFVVTWEKETCVKTTKVDYVGVGDIFLVVGQSNNTSVGETPQVYSHPFLKATMFGNDYLWKELIDPTDSPVNQVDAVSRDDTVTPTRGSYLPLLATKLMQLQNVPIAFIPAAKGNTTIELWQRNESNHEDRNTLYGSSVFRSKNVGNIFSILWWQGESDVMLPNLPDSYKNSLIKLASNYQEDLGNNLKIVTYQIGQTTPLGPNECLNLAIKEAVNSQPDKMILGPYLDDISLELDSCTKQLHFCTASQLQTVADRVYEVLINSIYVNHDIKIDGDLVDYGNSLANQVNIFDYNHLIENFHNPYSIFDYNNIVTNFEK